MPRPDKERHPAWESLWLPVTAASGALMLITQHALLPLSGWTARQARTAHQNCGVRLTKPHRFGPISDSPASESWLPAVLRVTSTSRPSPSAGEQQHACDAEPANFDRWCWQHPRRRCPSAESQACGHGARLGESIPGARRDPSVRSCECGVGHCARIDSRQALGSPRCRGTGARSGGHPVLTGPRCGARVQSSRASLQWAQRIAVDSDSDTTGNQRLPGVRSADLSANAPVFVGSAAERISLAPAAEP